MEPRPKKEAAVRKALEELYKPKGETKTLAMKVTLESLYNGAKREITIQRSRRCKECKGYPYPIVPTVLFPMLVLAGPDKQWTPILILVPREVSVRLKTGTCLR